MCIAEIDAMIKIAVQIQEDHLMQILFNKCSVYKFFLFTLYVIF